MWHRSGPWVVVLALTACVPTRYTLHDGGTDAAGDLSVSDSTHDVAASDVTDAADGIDATDASDTSLLPDVTDVGDAHDVVVPDVPTDSGCPRLRLCGTTLCTSNACTPDGHCDPRGDGREGDLSGSGAVNLVVAAQSSIVQRGQTIVVQTASGFSAGDEILIYVTTGQYAGEWQTNVICSVDSPTRTFHLGLPLTPHNAAAAEYQVVRVPHFSSVSSGAFSPAAWDSTRFTGGVLALRCAGAVDGSLSATGLGFAGGNTASGRGAGSPGEGLANTGGGGGPLCGACGVAGGGGGNHTSGSPGTVATGGGCVAGAGGFAIGAPLTVNQLRFGAGGGGGADTATTGVALSSGGNGGGLVLLAADSIGSSPVGAGGAVGGSGTSVAAAGGGGAGGTILLELANQTTRPAVVVGGGMGGGPATGCVGSGGTGGFGVGWVYCGTMCAGIATGDVSVANYDPATAPF